MNRKEFAILCSCMAMLLVAWLALSLAPKKPIITGDLTGTYQGPDVKLPLETGVHVVSLKRK